MLPGTTIAMSTQTKIEGKKVKIKPFKYVGTHIVKNKSNKGPRFTVKCLMLCQYLVVM